MYDSDYKQIEDRLLGIEASLIAQERGVDAGLAALGDLTDPGTIRWKLNLLIDVNEYEAAIELATANELNSRWADRAILALTALNRMQEAKDMLSWAMRDGDAAISQQCAVSYADGVVRRVFGERFTADRSLVKQFEGDLRHSIDLLKPVVAQAESDGHIRHEVELFAVRLRIRMEFALGNFQEIHKLAPILETWSPLPIELGLLALDRHYPTTESLVARLRTEHIDDFTCHLLASQLDVNILHNVEHGFATALKLTDWPTTPEQREGLATFLVGTSRGLGDEAQRQIASTLPSILAGQDRFLKLLEIESLLLKGLTKEAIPLLRETKDAKDLRWLQLSSLCYQQQGNSEQAIAELKRACELYPHPSMFGALASLALTYEKHEDAEIALENIVQVVPDDINALRALASTHWNLKHFDQAAKLFGRLSLLEPDQVSHRIDEAAALTLNADFDASLKIYETICSLENPPLKAVLGRTSMLRTLGQPNEAYKTLIEYKSRFWDDENFILALMDVASASGKDDAANEALIHLHQLQSEGKVSDGLIQQKSLNEFAEFIKEQDERNRSIHMHVLEGRLPWTFADSLMTRTVYYGWSIRTQKLRFLVDDPVTRSQYSVYSTNRYWPSYDSQVGKRLKELSSPPKDTPVVVDLSALITLQNLELLDKAAAYFGKLLVPSVYFNYIKTDIDRLSIHQLSQLNIVKQIKSAIDSQYINIVASVGQDLPIIDEYSSEPTENTISLRVLSSFLRDHGRITKEQYTALEKAIVRDMPDDNMSHQLEVNSRVAIDFWTLKTVVNCIGLDELVSTFVLCITEDDKKQIIASIRQFEFEEHIRTWHQKMWNYLRNNSHFIPVGIVAQPDEDDEHEKDDISLASYYVSLHNGYLLLADDRVCQGLALKQSSSSRGGAFGTDNLLVALGTSETIDNEQMANAFVKLIRWRYRFILPPTSVLLTLAKRYSQIPGQELLDVALYIHDCMRDLGLPSGFEPVEPPATIANSFYREWCLTVADFIVSMWDDNDTFDDDYVMKFTEWSISELLPSPPKNMQMFSYTMSSLTKHIVLIHALIRSGSMRSSERANQALLAISNSFGMTEGEYLRAVAEVINER